MSILVTGGAGFISFHLTERLLREGKEVIYLDDFNDCYDPRFKRANIQAVVHLAARARKLLSYFPRVSLEERIEKLIQWYRLSGRKERA